MKRTAILPILTGVLLALTLFAVASDEAFAANSGASKTAKVKAGSTVTALDPNNANAAKACIDAGGRIFTQKNGRKACSINYNSSKSNTGNLR